VGERRLLALGYRTTVITDSLQAEKAFRAASADFDIVVTDYSMPHMTGIDLGRALRAIRPEIPLILVTGLMEELAPERVQSVGIRRVLKKPITAHELGVAIHEVLASSTTT
jgi:CheY-like chemotaxis protein